MSVLLRCFGALGAARYFRHFFFGLAFTGFAFWTLGSSRGPVPPEAYFFTAANTVLYPYSRQAYESLCNLVVGENVFFWETWLFLFCKLLTMFGCWLFAIVIAPPVLVGLAAVAWWRSRNESNY